MNLEPVKLMPAFKDYLWGGCRLKEEFNKKSSLEKVAESWELSTHPDGESVIFGGEFDGKTLSEYLKENDVMGERAAAFDFFPVLIKFIDAADNLSIQVHPSDEYALEKENSFGKTEMWYVLECKEGAFLYYGLSREVTKEELEQRIKNNTLLEVLNKVPVKKGDVFFINSGTIHAICSGIVICEIQQNSNLTYRVYDYDRRDKFGNARELHVEKALQVSNLSPAQPYNSDGNILAECKYFTVEKYDVDGEKVLKSDCGCFRSVIVTDGKASLEMNGKELELIKGDSVFIPAQDGEYKVSGKCEIIVTYV